MRRAIEPLPDLTDHNLVRNMMRDIHHSTLYFDDEVLHEEIEEMMGAEGVKRELDLTVASEATDLLVHVAQWYVSDIYHEAGKKMLSEGRFELDVDDVVSGAALLDQPPGQRAASRLDPEVYRVPPCTLSEDETSSETSTGSFLSSLPSTNTAEDGSYDPTEDTESETGDNEEQGDQERGGAVAPAPGSRASEDDGPPPEDGAGSGSQSSLQQGSGQPFSSPGSRANEMSDSEMTEQGRSPQHDSGQPSSHGACGKARSEASNFAGSQDDGTLEGETSHKTSEQDREVAQWMQVRKPLTRAEKKRQAIEAASKYPDDPLCQFFLASVKACPSPTAEELAQRPILHEPAGVVYRNRCIDGRRLWGGLPPDFLTDLPEYTPSIAGSDETSQEAAEDVPRRRSARLLGRDQQPGSQLRNPTKPEQEQHEVAMDTDTQFQDAEELIQAEAQCPQLSAADVEQVLLPGSAASSASGTVSQWKLEAPFKGPSM